MKLSRNLYQKEKESELLQSLRDGSQEAFEKIFKHYWKGLYKHANSKLHSKEAAEELVQNVFVTLWAKREQLLITNLEYYLHTSIKNGVLNCIRSKVMEKKYWDFYKKFFPASKEETEETVYYDDLTSAIEEGASSLNSKTKIIFQLSRMDGYSVSEIARKLNVSEKTVEYHITRSLKVMKSKLSEYLLSVMAVSLFLL